MGTRSRFVASIAMLVGLLVAVVASPKIGEAAMAAKGAKWTVSLTKDYTPSPWTSEAGYVNRALAKLGFGLKNALLGWTEVILEPKRAIEGDGNFFVGVWKGLLNGVGQELGGAVHVLTFPLTELDAPLPDGGTQLLKS